MRSNIFKGVLIACAILAGLAIVLMFNSRARDSQQSLSGHPSGQSSMYPSAVVEPLPGELVMPASDRETAISNGQVFITADGRAYRNVDGRAVPVESLSQPTVTRVIERPMVVEKEFVVERPTAVRTTVVRQRPATVTRVHRGPRIEKKEIEYDSQGRVEKVEIDYDHDHLGGALRGLKRLLD